jgi:hypothetical protein
MKKIILGLLVILGACTLFFGGSALARSGGIFCDNSPSSEDQRLFPHGFICGTDATATGPAFNAGWDGSTPLPGTIDEGTSITVRGGYNQSKPPPGTGRVLVWITVDGGPSVTDPGNIDMIFGGNKSLACPNHSGNINNPGPVYGYRDLPTDAVGTYDDPAYDNQNRNEQSPYAYDRVNNKGYVDCGTQGSMVYWTDAGESRSGYGLRLNIPDDAGGSSVCIRMNISVMMPEDGSQWFPGRTGSQTAVQQHVAAAHLAKQSDRYCYNIRNVPHPNTYTASFDATCDRAFGRLTQYNNAGTPTNANVAYVLQHWNPGTGAWENITGARSSVGRNWSTQDAPAVSFDGDAYFGNGGAAAFRLVSIQFGILPDPVRYPGGYIKSGLDCHDDPAVVSFTPTCHSVYLDAFYDADTWSGPRGAINVYERSNGSRGWTDLNPGTSGQTIEYNQPPDQRNSGYDIYVSAYNTFPSGRGGGTDWGTVVEQGQSIGPCYAATCSLQATATATWLPINKVEQGQQFTLTATINNTGDVDNNPLYSNLDGQNLSITPGQYQPNGTGNGADNGSFGFNSPVAMSQTIGLGESKSVSFNLTAPGGINRFTLDAYPDFYGRFSIIKGPTDPFGNPSGNNIAQHCQVTLDLYKHFTLTPHAAMVGFNNEDPTTLSYQPWVTDDEHVNDSGGGTGGIPASTDWSLYKLDPVTNGPSTTFNSGSDPNTRILTNAAYGSVAAQPDHRKDYGVLGPYANPPNSYQAGDQYCAKLHIDHSTGYIGPGDDLQVVSPATALSCPHVNNKPYFKVFGGSISAGGSFKSQGTSCTNPPGEGILAGYNNNTASAGYDFGASAQLSAWALAKITGVASAQTKYNRDTRDLSFANTVNRTPNGSYDPAMGGDFGPNNGGADTGQVNCLTKVEPVPGPHPDVPGLDNVIDASWSGEYVHTTGTTIKLSGTVHHNVSVFTTGNVIIDDDLQYDNRGNWDTDSVPSLVVHAGGNIYINSNVSKMDGMYLSEQANGKIYTCTNDETLVPKGPSYFATCSKRLLIRGSFVADHINLMRTFGTMRDEKPLPAGSQIGLVWSCGGGACNPAIGSTMNCVNIYNTDEPTAFTWMDNRLCAPAGTALTYNITTVPSTLNQAKRDSGLPYCTLINPPGELRSWDNNWLCSNKDISFISDGNTSGKYCTYIFEPLETHNSSIWNSNKTYICEPLAPSGLPTSLSCSNDDGSNALGRSVAGTTAGTTCAAEVFDFSPEQYLSHPAIAKPKFGGTVWDSITSLPPVL